MAMEVKIDSRLCVKRADNGFSIDRQDIAIPDAIEVLARLVSYMRMRALGISSEYSGRNVIDHFAFSPDEPIDTPKVCIAFDYETKKIQASVIGMTLWEACVLIDMGHSYFSAMQLGLIAE